MSKRGDDESMKETQGGFGRPYHEQPASAENDSSHRSTCGFLGWIVPSVIRKKRKDIERPVNDSALKNSESIESFDTSFLRKLMPGSSSRREKACQPRSTLPLTQTPLRCSNYHLEHGGMKEMPGDKMKCQADSNLLAGDLALDQPLKKRPRIQAPNKDTFLSVAKFLNVHNCHYGETPVQAEAKMKRSINNTTICKNTATWLTKEGEFMEISDDAKPRALDRNSTRLSSVPVNDQKLAENEPAACPTPRLGTSGEEENMQSVVAASLNKFFSCPHCSHREHISQAYEDYDEVETKFGSLEVDDQCVQVFCKDTCEAYNMMRSHIIDCNFRSREPNFSDSDCMMLPPLYITEHYDRKSSLPTVKQEPGVDDHEEKQEKSGAGVKSDTKGLKARATNDAVEEIVTSLLSKDEKEQSKGLEKIIVKLLNVEDFPGSRSKPTLAKAMFDFGVVKQLVSFLQDDAKSKLAVLAMRALDSVVLHYRNESALRESNIIPSMASLLSNKNHGILKQAICSLGNISTLSPTYRDLVLESDTLSLLLDLFGNDELPPELVRLGADTLSHLCGGEPRPPFEKVSRACTTLVKLLNRDDNILLETVCRTLSCMCNGRCEGIQAILEHSICDRLVDLSQSLCPGVQVWSVATIKQACNGSESFCHQMVQAKPALGLLLSSNHLSVQQDACRAVAHLAGGGQLEFILQSSVISSLMALLSHNNKYLRRNALQALCIAANKGNPTQLRDLSRQGYVQRLCGFLEKSEEYTDLKRAMKILEILLPYNCNVPRATRSKLQALSDSDHSDAVIRRGAENLLKFVNSAIGSQPV